MALLTPQQIGYNTTITTAAAATSNTAVADDRCWFEVTVGATSTTVALVVPGSSYGQARPDVSTGAVTNTTRRFGPLVPDLATDGVVEVTCSQVTNVTIALVRI
jgi:hypothetical protein